MLLLIDTSTDKATIALATDGKIIAENEDKVQSNHAAFLQPGIRKLLENANVDLKSLEAVAVMGGPGSYTGLRVGMASAKGLCYALNIPLIIVNTLEAMALSVLNQLDDKDKHNNKIAICPMIDARRMEVFTAVYDKKMNEMLSPAALILDQHTFGDLISKYKMIFTGNAVAKFTTVLQHQINYITNNNINPAFAILANNALQQKSFASLPYSEPVYLKAVYIATK